MHFPWSYSELFNSGPLCHVSVSNGHSPRLEGSLPLGRSHSHPPLTYTCKLLTFYSQTQTMCDATNMHREIREQRYCIVHVRPVNQNLTL